MYKVAQAIDQGYAFATLRLFHLPSAYESGIRNNFIQPLAAYCSSGSDSSDSSVLASSDSTATRRLLSLEDHGEAVTPYLRKSCVALKRVAHDLECAQNRRLRWNSVTAPYNIWTRDFFAKEYRVRKKMFKVVLGDPQWTNHSPTTVGQGQSVGY